MPAKRTSGHIVQDEGTSLAQAAFLDFAGAGVSAATASGKTTVTIPAGTSSINYESRSTNTILGVSDTAKAIDITASITQTFEADETLGDGWWVILRNATTAGFASTVTLDPAGGETIDGASTLIMYPGDTRLVMCNGAGGNFNTVLLNGSYTSGEPWQTVVKLADQSISSDTTVGLDDELFFTTVSGATYEVYLVVVYASPTGGSTPDLKVAIGEDTTPRGSGVFNGQSNGVVSISFDTDATPKNENTDVADRAITVTGVHLGNGGTFGFLWSQVTSSVNATIVRAGSVLRYRRIT